jgi:hypothetical protein
MVTIIVSARVPARRTSLTDVGSVVSFEVDGKGGAATA